MWQACAAGENHPGLRRHEVSKGQVATPQGPSPYHLVALLSFDSMAAIGGAFASSEGQATAADLGNFAQAGAQLLICDTHPA
ncbi:MAG: EthD family reductase [Reyranellaceae bacterium]